LHDKELSGSCPPCKFSHEEEKLVVEMQATSGPKLLVLFQDALTMMSKNFWSTRQKHILRVLQHPKMPSGSTDASADRSDLSKDPSL